MSKLLFFFGSYMVGKRTILYIHTWRKVMISGQNGSGLGLGASFVITNGLLDFRHLFLTNCSYFSANSGRFPSWLRNWNHRKFRFRYMSFFAQQPGSSSFATSFSRTLSRDQIIEERSRFRYWLLAIAILVCTIIESNFCEGLPLMNIESAAREGARHVLWTVSKDLVVV